MNAAAVAASAWWTRSTTVWSPTRPVMPVAARLAVVARAAASGGAAGGRGGGERGGDRRVVGHDRVLSSTGVGGRGRCRRVCALSAGAGCGLRQHVGGVGEGGEVVGVVAVGDALAWGARGPVAGEGGSRLVPPVRGGGGVEARGQVALDVAAGGGGGFAAEAVGVGQLVGVDAPLAVGVAVAEQAAAVGEGRADEVVEVVGGGVEAIGGGVDGDGGGVVAALLQRPPGGAADRVGGGVGGADGVEGDAGAGEGVVFVGVERGGVGEGAEVAGAAATRPARRRVVAVVWLGALVRGEDGLRVAPLRRRCDSCQLLRRPIDVEV